jgi:PST family polysaccharide transporter
VTITSTNAATPSDAAAPPHAGDGASELDRSFARSVAWSGAGRWLTQIISWPATIVIARMLSPEDYGLVVLVRVYTNFISMLSEAGLGGIVTITPEMDDNRAGQLHTLSRVLGVAAVVVSCTLAFPLARVYKRPGMEWVVFALSALFIIEAAGVVPNGLLRREFRYKTLAVADWARSVADLAVELTLASLGFGYWTLVFGYIAGSTAWQAVVQFNRRVRFRRVHLPDVRVTLRMMSHMLAQLVSSFTVGNSDVIIGGRLVSSAAMGAYTFGAQLAAVPNAKVTSLIANVTPSLFREVRGDLPLFRRYILLITLALTAVVLPAFVGIVIVAQDFTSVVLGAKWSAIVLPLRFLALNAAMQAMFTVLPQVLWATDNGRIVTRLGFVNLVVFPTLFFVFGRTWGITGLGAAWFVGTTLVSLPLARAALKIVQLPAHDYVKSLWPAVSSSLVMTLTVAIAQRLATEASWAPAARLALSVTVGALAYGGTIAVFHRAQVKRALAIVKTLRK